MHNLRDALLDPSPKGFADHNTATKTALDQQDVCVRGAAFYNRTSIATEQYCALGDSVDLLKRHLFSL
jgi:hypothetical protein